MLSEKAPADRPPLTTYEQLAKMIDHSLLRPQLTEQDVIQGCQVALRYRVANVTVRPADVELAVSLVQGSDVKVGTVAGFPHGSSTTATKLFETEDVLKRGAQEVDVVINIGRLLSRQFRYVEEEIRQITELCHAYGAIVKIIFENAYLTDDLKIAACQMCKAAGADFAKTSTGFAPSGATLEDLRLMYKHCAPEVKVKAAGGVRTLEAAIQVYEVGCSRLGATATVEILEAWKRRLDQIAACKPSG